MTILNLTQHAATAEQISHGVVDLSGAQLEHLKKLLSFEELPVGDRLRSSAHGIKWIVQTHFHAHTKWRERCLGAQPLPPVVMIGGAPFLMGLLEKTLKDAGVVCVYAFSRRESVEEVQTDGSVRKVTVFRHAGFVEAAV